MQSKVYIKEGQKLRSISGTVHLKTFGKSMIVSQNAD